MYDWFKFKINKIYTLERKWHQHQLAFLQVLHPVRIGIWRCGFLRREENQRIWKYPKSKARTNNKFNPHMVLGWHQTRIITVGGDCSHHCTIIFLQPLVKNYRLLFKSDWLTIRVADNKIHEFVTPEPDRGHYPFILGADNSNNVRLPMICLLC